MQGSMEAAQSRKDVLDGEALTSPAGSWYHASRVYETP